jgi:methylmalonyl-CoA epimerase
MPKEAVFKEVLQVGLVVKDIDEAVRKYSEVSGIGPWEIHIMDNANMHDTKLHGKNAEFSMKVAFASVGNMQLELIEPLNDENIYAEFLREHGEGLHHIACAVDDFDKTITDLNGKGCGVLQEGVTKDGMGFAYLDTQDAMSCITEIYKFPDEKDETTS